MIVLAMLFVGFCVYVVGACAFWSVEAVIRMREAKRLKKSEAEKAQGKLQ